MSVSGGPKSALARLVKVEDGLGLCWTGNAGWLIRGDGRLVGIDLDLKSKSLLRRPAVSAEELAPELDVLFVTHGHGDHFNDATASVLAARGGCVFVVPANCAEKAHASGIPDARVRVARPGQPFDLDGMPVEPTRAFHGHVHQSVHRGANLDDCGYVLTLAGRRIFHPGDSVLTEDQLALKDIDVLFVSPTAHNMHVRPAATLIRALSPAWIFPQHFDTYVVTPDNAFWTVGCPDDLRAALPDDLRARFHKLPQGDVFVIARA